MGGVVVGGGSAGAAGVPVVPAAGGHDDGPGGGGAESTDGGAEFSGGAGPSEEPPLGELPHELSGSPVSGVLTLSEVGPAGDKIFHIVTPLATYGVAAASGTITTLEDRSGGNVVQWVASGAKRRRRAGIVSNPQPVMRTTLDSASFTARHARLLSASDDGAWAWSWDFYVTQATLTLTKAGGAYSFTFSGTPGDQLTDADRVADASGLGQSAVGSLLADLPGPAEWAYITDSTYGHSLFVIQHHDDDLPDRYDAIGGDTATWIFGDGKATDAQRRYSLGFIGSAAHANVSKRVQFLLGAVR
jgi:hypothetical protein